MKNTVKKNLIVVIALFLVAILTIGVSFSTTNNANAAIVNKVIFSDQFINSDINTEKWAVNTGDGKIAPVAQGNGVFNISYKMTGYMNSSIYYDKYIDVADGENLIIEYDVADFVSADAVNNVMLVKGLGSSDSKPSKKMEEDVDAKLEGITSYSKDDGRRYTALGYAIKDGVIAVYDSEYQLSLSDSERSQAVLNYYKSLYIYDPDYDAYGVGQEGTDGVRSWSGETELAVMLDNALNYNIEASHIFDKGFTFRHTYFADGSYLLEVKKSTQSNASYKEFITLDATLGSTGEKRFTNLSGYVGFNLWGNPTSFSLNFFKVYTDDGVNATTEIDCNFDINADGERFDDYDENWSQTEKMISYETTYDRQGLLFDNPTEENYIYSKRTYIKYDGNFDDYAEINATLSVTDITVGKSFGFIFGGSREDQLLKSNGMIYVYLTKTSNSSNCSVGVDYIKNGFRCRVGALKEVEIPATAISGEEEFYNFNILAKHNGSLVVTITDSEGNVTDVNTFKDANEKLIIKNKFAVYCAGEEGNAEIFLKNFTITNKYFNSLGLDTKSVFENFDEKDENGNAKLGNGISIYQGTVNPYIPNAGVYTNNGAVEMRGVGYKSGIGSDYAYDSYIMYFDVVDIQRTREVDENGKVIPVSARYLHITFGSLAPGVDTGSGYSLEVINPLTMSTDSPRLDQAEAELSQNSFIGVGGKEAGFARHNFLDPALDGYTIRYKLEYKIDGTLTFGYTVLELESYDMLDKPIATVQLDDCEGYIGISSDHSLSNVSSCNMVIDNVRIINTDSLSLEMESNGGNSYQPDNDTPTIIEDKGGLFNWLTYTLIGISVVCLGACVTLFVVKKGGKKS